MTTQGEPMTTTTEARAIACPRCGTPIILIQASGAPILADLDHPHAWKLGDDLPSRSWWVVCTNDHPHTLAIWARDLEGVPSWGEVVDELKKAGNVDPIAQIDQVLAEL